MPLKKASLTQGVPIPAVGGEKALYLTVFNRITAKYNVRKYRKGQILQVASIPPFYCMQDAVKVSSNEIKKFKLRCGSNYCPYCFKINMSILQKRLLTLIFVNNLDHFITLTLDSKNIPVGYINKTHNYLTSLFHVLVSGLRYRYPKLAYIWVIEFQNIGNAHMHLVTNKYLPIKYLRKRWVRIGGGNEINVQLIKSIEAVSRYLAKYLTKDNEGGNKFYYMERRWGKSFNLKESFEEGGDFNER